MVEAKILLQEVTLNPSPLAGDFAHRKERTNNRTNITPGPLPCRPATNSTAKEVRHTNALHDLALVLWNMIKIIVSNPLLLILAIMSIAKRKLRS